MKENSLSLYLHVPFCKSLCPYCAFYKSLNLKAIPAWLDQMEAEIKEAAKSLKRNGQKLSTLYFGGGSPGLLSAGQIERLIAPLRPYFDKNMEWSLELNPEQADEIYLQNLKALGITRISLGVQSFDPKRLQALGRCSRSQIDQAIEKIQSLNFSLSIDLIYGHVDQSLDELEKDLDTFLEKEIDHISLYALQIEEKSVYGKKGMEKCSIEKEQQMDQLIRKKLSGAGYEHYEISSFARNRAWCRHNLAYWSDRYYIGLGPGASGYDPFGYYARMESLYHYVKGERKAIYEPRDLFTALMMGLRTQFGLDIQRLEKEYECNLFALYGSVFEKYAEYIQIEQGKIFLSEQGRDLLDFILLDLLCCSN